MLCAQLLTIIGWLLKLPLCKSLFVDLQLQIQRPVKRHMVDKKFANQLKSRFGGIVQT